MFFFLKLEATLTRTLYINSMSRTSFCLRDGVLQMSERVFLMWCVRCTGSNNQDRNDGFSFDALFLTNNGIRMYSCFDALH